MSDTIELFDKRECPFCWRVRLALFSRGINYRSRDRQDPEVQARWKTLSPQRTVPVFVHGDLVLTDSQVILEYLQDRFGGLLPDDSVKRADVRSLVNYADSVLGKAVKKVIFEKRDRPESQWDRNVLREGREGFVSALPALERRLGKRVYFSDAYSMAECALVPRFALAGAYGLTIPHQYAGLSAWLTRAVKANGFAETAPPKVVS